MKQLIKDTVKNIDADYIEVRVEDTSETKISFQGEKLENLEESQRFGGNIRALVNGVWGFVTFNSLSGLNEKVKLAVKNARIAGSKNTEKLILAKVSPVEEEILPQIINSPFVIPLKDKVALLSDYNNLLLSYDEKIKSTSVRYFDKDTTVYFANSEGTYISNKKLDLGCNLVAIAVSGDNTQYGFVGKGSSNDFNILVGIEEELRQACEKAVSLLSSNVINAGEYTVILNPVLSGTFIHEAFGHLSEGDNVYEDKKLQKIMTLGRTFGNPSLNVYDSGRDIGHRGYLKYDDEGVPTEKTYLIKNGKLTGRLHSRETAGKMGEKATGNARAINYNYPPICRMRNTCIERGEVPFKDMLKDIKNGIYAKDTIGGQTNGEMFTFTAGEAFMIRDGKIEESVRDVTLSGNVFTTLANIDMIGDDFKIEDSAGGCGKGGQMPLPISHGSPHIRIQNIVIGGKS